MPMRPISSASLLCWVPRSTLRLLTSLLRRLHRQAADCFLRCPRSPHGKGRDSSWSPRRPRHLEEVFRVLGPPPPFVLALSHSLPCCRIRRSLLCLFPHHGK